MNNRHFRRATAVAVSLAMALGPIPVLAQTPGVGPAVTPPGDQAAGVVDPPARVGRLASVVGTVSFHLADAERWEPAQVNLPVTTGSAFWTEPGARAVLEAASTRMAMDQSTELDIRQLDDRALVAALPQGRAYLRVQGLGSGESASVQTPRGVVALLKPGRYEVAAGDTQAATVVTVVEGEAEMTVAGAAVHVGPNEAATITGDGQGAPLEARLGAASRDPFLTARLAEERPVRRAAVTPPAEVARMTGGTELEEYGNWASTPEYGPVWYPPTGADYVPYRQGHWAFVQPWGWTWVDDAPWGFAPSHYGRWAEVNDRWGWVPGGSDGEPYPVYAPAVVSFLAGAAVGALVAGGVGWVPLGPREPYYPPYRASDRYVRAVNVGHVTNVSNVVTTYNRQVVNNAGGGLPEGPLVNRRGATIAPGTAMVDSRSLAGVARPLPAGGFPANAAFAARPPVMPSQATLGVTPAVAQQLRLAPAVNGPGRPAAPGPALRAGGSVPLAAPGAGPGWAAGVPGGGVGPGIGQGAPGPGGGMGALGGAAVGAAAGVAAGALLRPGVGSPGGPMGPRGGAPTIARPGGGIPAFTPGGPGAAGLPGLREPGQPGGFRPNGGAPGPALPSRANEVQPGGVPGGIPGAGGRVGGFAPQPGGSLAPGAGLPPGAGAPPGAGVPPGGPGAGPARPGAIGMPPGAGRIEPGARPGFVPGAVGEPPRGLLPGVQGPSRGEPGFVRPGGPVEPPRGPLPRVQGPGRIEPGFVRPGGPGEPPRGPYPGGQGFGRPMPPPGAAAPAFHSAPPQPMPQMRAGPPPQMPQVRAAPPPPPPQARPAPPAAAQARPAPAGRPHDPRQPNQ